MRLSETGHDMVLCQICGRDVDTGAEQVLWKPEITANKSAGNVCSQCMFAHATTKLSGDALRARVATTIRTQRKDGPISLAEHCRQESGGLTGAALTAYINRHYGHG